MVILQLQAIGRSGWPHLGCTLIETLERPFRDIIETLLHCKGAHSPMVRR